MDRSDVDVAFDVVCPPVVVVVVLLMFRESRRQQPALISSVVLNVALFGWGCRYCGGGVTIYADADANN